MRHRFVILFCLILAGEAIFSLPFHVARFFRASLLDVFGFTNANLGDVFAVYGITAMLAYFPGGAIADRFSTRKLLSVSLIATAIGGFYMASIPDIAGMTWLFAYWGATSILLFWSALIKSTREWGGTASQGRAFGLLDGGRGLLAAGLASIAVVFFSRTFEPALSGGEGDARAALVTVIYFYTATTFAAGIFTWMFVPEQQPGPSSAGASFAKMGSVIRRPTVWAQAFIVICAYCGYKGLDNYSLYAVEVLGMSEVEGARFTSNCAYLRPIAAVAAGFLADKISASRMMLSLFVALAACNAYLGFAVPNDQTNTLLFANILFSFAGVYALRGVYFALLEESQVPGTMTGTAVGLISLVGFTPDIFFAAIGGRLIDNTPGVGGHQDYFIFLAAIMALGLCATALLLYLARAKPRT